MKLDLEAFRHRLQGDLVQLRESIAQANEAASTVTLDQSSVGRLSRMDAMQQQAMARGMQERLATRQRKLEAALARIDAGTFGRCCQCDAEIDPERLEGDPAAVFCVDCMTELGRDGGQREAR
jgi:DnaK suppressor protein